MLEFVLLWLFYGILTGSALHMFFGDWLKDHNLIKLLWILAPILGFVGFVPTAVFVILLMCLFPIFA